MRMLENAPDRTGEFPLDVPDYVLYLAFQVTRRRDQMFDAALAPLQLSLTHWRVLTVIRRLGACAMTELALYTTIDRTTLTRSIDSLVAMGRVERSDAPNDRRKVILKLTPEGEAAYRKAAEVLIDGNRRAFAGVSEADGRIIARGLRQVIGNLVADEELAASILRMGPPE